MAAQTLSQQLNLIDSAIGPLSIQTTVYKNFDVDDFVHSSAVAQAQLLRLIFAAGQADPTFAANRTPINLEGTSVGGY
jgi:hypothetical protein